MVEQVTQPLEDVEFTYRWYRDFLQRLLSAGYDFRSFSDRLGSGDIVLRHDVDLSIDAAVTMARLEAELDIRSTYCFLLTSSLYNPLESTYRDALREIGSLGHEIALHFSTHEYWPTETPPDAAEIERRVADEQSILETVIGSTPDTVSFHRPPSWVLDRKFDGFRNTYAPDYFSDLGYIADSSQRWRTDPPPVDELPDSMQLLTHPGLWRGDDGSFETRIEQAIEDARDHVRRDTSQEFIPGGTDV